MSFMSYVVGRLQFQQLRMMNFLWPLTVVGQLWPGTAAVNDQREWWNPHMQNQAHPSAASGIENILLKRYVCTILFESFDLTMFINFLGT